VETRLECRTSIMFTPDTRIAAAANNDLCDKRSRRKYVDTVFTVILVHGQVTIIFVVSIGLSVCLSVCLFVCAEFFSAVFNPISIKLGHMLYDWV